MERWCSRCGKPAVGMQSGVIVTNDDAPLRWSESLCRSCLDAIERTMPPSPTPSEEAAAAEQFLAHLRADALSAEAAGDTARLRALGPMLDDLAVDFPRPIPADLLEIAARYRAPGA